ncbi:hypothetical protein ABZW30_41055 [Kitasatospora sp. NPDC004669]|uniref:hypothetical protein n=1 Tax=Kitasatospora sp. NPDC004669 TaxID=3154555 RepID=UPI0033AFF9DA
MGFPEWLDIYQEAWFDDSTPAGRVCPDCGRADLHLVFTLPRSSSGSVMAALWCGACLRGIHLGNCPRPETRKIWNWDDAQRERPVPNYTLIPPE